MAEVRIKDIDEHEIDTILAEDIDFEGHLSFTKPLMIKGRFKGEIKSTSALYIGEKAYVEARTEADVVSSKGKHKGDILGHARVELYSTARVDGDITTPDFVMESGCKFNGYCNMSGGAVSKDAPASAPEAAASQTAADQHRAAGAPGQAGAAPAPRPAPDASRPGLSQPQAQRPQQAPGARPPAGPTPPGAGEPQRGGGQK